MEIHLGEAGVLVWGEDVAVVVPEGVGGLLVEVDGDGAVLEVVERSDVVEACDVVAVGVGDEDGVDACGAGAEHLLAEVGADVEEDVQAVGR